MNTKGLVIGATILGIIFIAIALVYWTVPAQSLPHFMPGFALDSSKIHIKHGIASFLLGLALFALAWFKSAKKAQ